jgi:hypothetical protein
MALALASINGLPKLKGRLFRFYAARVFFRLRRKSVKKTEYVSVKKISLFDDQREEFGNF